MLPTAQPNPYPSLPAVSEPFVARQLADAMIAGDARMLAALADREVLGALGEAIQPVSIVFEMRFLGAVERNGEVLVAYAVEGRDRSGQDVPVGVVLRVVDNQVVGVN